MVDSFGELEAASLFCPRCKQANPVRKKLLLLARCDPAPRRHAATRLRRRAARTLRTTRAVRFHTLMD